jgi:molybdopterin-guanine dinucleotide biosynthesis protein A
MRAPRAVDSKPLRSRIEICILAGGQSTRMGQDKARLRLEGRTMLSIVRAVAEGTGLRVQVIRRDLVPRCGPLGGILTGLRSAKAGAVLFLACDMPLITTTLLRKIVLASDEDNTAVFSSQSGRVTFPLLLPVQAADAVQKQIDARRLSVQQLAVKLRRQKLCVGPGHQLFNVNTPEDASVAERLLGRTTKARPKARLQSRKGSRRD